MILTRLLPALALVISATAALAQEDRPAVDLIASIFGGVADGATAIIAEEMRFARSAAGRFEGRTPAGEIATLTVDETAPCLFLMTYSFQGTTFPVRIDYGMVRSIAFEPEEGEVPALPVAAYEVMIEGDEGLAVRLLPGGETTPLKHSPPIATSVPRAELEAAAARLKELCPAR